MFQPVIKWSGSKRSQANEIIKYFPKEIDTDYEPFCGGCSVLRTLLESDIKVNKYVCSDINHVLICLWKTIICDKVVLADSYERMWLELYELETQGEKRSYYERIRKIFNNNASPNLFLFLNRTCFNGLIRYNLKGEFNSPFHLNRNGIEPSKMRKIIYEWSDILNNKNVEFKCCSYEYINTNKNDVVYLDPPYAHSVGMYNGEFDNERFFEWMKNLKCKYALSYDGKSGNEDNTFALPTELYNDHHYIKSGNSSFKRIKQSDNKAMVYESLYIKN